MKRPWLTALALPILALPVLALSQFAPGRGALADDDCSGPSAVARTEYVVNDSAVVDHLKGNVHQGDRVTARYTMAPACADAQVSLVAYRTTASMYSRETADQQVLVSSATSGRPGESSLSVTVPSCFFQIDFVRGIPIRQLGPAASTNFYNDQGRLIDAENGGTNTCPAGSPAAP